MSKRIALFNHKGGVAKTLTAYHLGWILTKRHHRVLLVDGDSQVNLTAITLGAQIFDNYYDSPETAKRNIKDGVAPVFEGRPIAIEGFECPTALGNESLFILPGHLELSQYEGQLSLAQETGGTLSVLQNLPGALTGLIARIEDIHGIDFTIVDLNPGLGAINQNLFLAANYFIVPTNPDPFSKMALETLANRVTRWDDWKRTALQIYANSLYPLAEGQTTFIGSITSRFNKHASKAAARFDERIREIDETVRDVLVPKLENSGMMLPREKYREALARCPDMGPGTPSSEYSLARIPDFQSLAQTASRFEVPVFEISDEMLKETGLGGNSLDAAQRNREQFQMIFDCVGAKAELLADAK